MPSRRRRPLACRQGLPGDRRPLALWPDPIAGGLSLIGAVVAEIAAGSAVTVVKSTDVLLATDQA